MSTAEKKELAQLRKRARQLEQENEIPEAGGRVFRAGERPPKVKFRLAHELAADEYDIEVACRVLSVQRLSYYEWQGRPESARSLRDKELTKMIEQVHEDSRGSYGWPRVHAELVLGLGEPINHKRVQRFMREAGIQGVYRRKRHHGLANQATEDDLVQRQFTVEAPDTL